MLRLKELRLNHLNSYGKKINQGELAKILNVSRTTVTMWENGNSVPDVVMLQTIADFFNVSVDYLLGRDEINTVSPSSSTDFTAKEIALIKKTRALDASGFDKINAYLDGLLAAGQYETVQKKLG